MAMPLRCVVRVLAIVALFFAFIPGNSVQAATIGSLPIHADLDLGDDDGDGIPNYLDPDDNNDGITDEDTPVIPTPGQETPDSPGPDQNDTGVTPAEPGDTNNAPVTNAPPVSSKPNSNVTQAPQVTSLPETGVGSTSTILSHSGLLLTAMATLVLTTMALRSRAHMQ